MDMWHARQPLLYSLVSRCGTCDEETPALSIQIMINSTPHPPLHHAERAFSSQFPRPSSS